MSPPNKKSIFPQKLWRMVNDDQLRYAICWSVDGTSFFVYEQSLKILCLGKENNIFHTKQPKSFVRQLHLYGFRKVNKNQFMHPYFIRGQPELIKKIHRSYKSSNSSTSSENSDGTSTNGNMIEMRSPHCHNNNLNHATNQLNNFINDTPESKQSTFGNQLYESTNINKQVRIMSEEQNCNDHTAIQSIDQQQVYQSVKTEVIEEPPEWYESSYTDISFNYYEDNMITMYNNEVYPNTFNEI